MKLFFVYRESKLPCVFIFNAFTWFFLPVFIYMNQWAMIFHRHSGGTDIDECRLCTFFYHIAHYSFVFLFHSLLDIRKMRIFIRIITDICANDDLLNKEYDPNWDLPYCYLSSKKDMHKTFLWVELQIFQSFHISIYDTFV